MEFDEILRQVVLVAMTIGYIKHLSGYHFPWEKCACCGKRYRDHKKE